MQGHGNTHYEAPPEKPPSWTATVLTAVKKPSITGRSDAQYGEYDLNTGQSADASEDSDHDVLDRLTRKPAAAHSVIATTA